MLSCWPTAWLVAALRFLVYFHIRRSLWTSLRTELRCRKEEVEIVFKLCSIYFNILETSISVIHTRASK